MDPEPANDIERILFLTLASSEEIDPEGNRCFSPGKFFTNWFRKSGSAHFFLFRKNLKVTNIQFAELLSLIRSHTQQLSKLALVYNLQFMSVSEFKEAISNLVEAFPRLDKESRYDFIAKQYCQIISQHIVVDCFYGSCAVFVPPLLRLDIEAVCAYSGYIHSCGHNIFIRNIDKATTEEFYDVIGNYVEHSVGNDKPVFFSVYAHEDFTEYDREKKEYLRNGLDDVKVYVEKFYMGSERLTSVLNDMAQRFAGKLIIPDPGNYNEQHQEIRDKGGIDRTRTLWLLVDRSTGEGAKETGPHRYFICYEQQLMNENPFPLFDENKPAWIGPITIPHTLLAAMINIAEPTRVKSEVVVLGDPFVGTGTTWLEALKYPRVKPLCSDWADITPLLIKDNLSFFSASYLDLRPIQKSLEYIAMADSERHGPNFIEGISYEEVNRAYDWMMGFLEKVSPVKGIPKDLYSFSLSNSNIKKLESRKPLDRVLFYLALRTVLKNIGAFERKSATWESIYKKEAAVLGFQFKRLRDLKRREAESKDRSKDFTIFQGSYSMSCSINFDLLNICRDELRSRSQIKVSDARKLKKRSYDIIVTDPPYGFNTEDDIQKLAELYSQCIRVMLDALKQEGQLIISLPDRSHTGRRSPFFTHKELVIQQVLSIAEQAKREVIIPAYSVPQQKDLFHPPYYWESERALRRAILHFRVRDL